MFLHGIILSFYILHSESFQRSFTLVNLVLLDTGHACLIFFLLNTLKTLKLWTNHTDVVLMTCPGRFLSKIDCTNKSVDKRIVHYYAYARIYLRLRTMRTHYIRSLSMPLGGPLSAPNTSSIDAFHVHSSRPRLVTACYVNSYACTFLNGNFD